MGVINLLESKVYNQISAGEVVENPASIVKELVENSIDAGAKSITVSIQDGGIKSIIVADDGCGMDKSDLKLSILPHATSKIKESADLETIGTLGFRGEALASVAAVSEVEIRSCHAGKANTITVKGGEVVEEKETSLNMGTVIKVSSLFFNTPARFKFLKAPKSEENAVTRLMLELIFANPYVAIKYSADNEVIYQTEGNGLEKTLFSVYDGDFANNMVHFSNERSNYRVEGYAARPASSAIKNNRKNQIIIINGRSISDSAISSVVQNAYTDKLMKRTFPSFIIDIVAPFDMIDVNVHPNKKEVRFAESRVIHGLIYHTILDALTKDEESNVFLNIYSPHAENVNTEPNMVSFALPKNDLLANVSENEDITANEPTIQPVNKIQMYNPSGMQIKEELTENAVFQLSDVITKVPTQELVIEEESLYRVVGQVFDTYLLVEFENKLFFIDQHAVHEKILYNRIVESYEKNSQAQDLLIPYEIELSYEDIEYLKQNILILKKFGFNVAFNEKSIEVLAIPAMLMYLDIPAFFNQFVAEKFSGKTIYNVVIKEKIATIACKSAIKGGDKLSDVQIRYVLDYFIENSLPIQCPHGRPTVCEITKNDIEKMFKRVL